MLWRYSDNFYQCTPIFFFWLILAWQIYQFKSYEQLQKRNEPMNLYDRRCQVQFRRKIRCDVLCREFGSSVIRQAPKPAAAACRGFEQRKNLAGGRTIWSMREFRQYWGRWKSSQGVIFQFAFFLNYAIVQGIVLAPEEKRCSPH